jgi:hypothetical protein
MMRLFSRSVFTLAATAGLPAAAAAQELIRVTYSWQEVAGLTTTPVTNPNSILDPGEGARISLQLDALINGSNAVGQTTTYTPPPPPGAGTVRGLASFLYNLRGDGGAATAAGSWGNRTVRILSGIGEPYAGTVLLNGALVDSFGGGQFVAPGGTANSLNPVADAFRGVWKPTDYSPRSVNWLAEPGTATPAGQHNGILVSYGITRPDPNDPTTWYDNYLNKYISSDFGNGISIPIAPAPSSASILAGFAAASLGRRRRHCQAQIPISPFQRVQPPV